LTVEYRGPTLFFHDLVTMPSEVITIVVGSTAILKVVNAGIRRWKLDVWIRSSRRPMPRSE
jgi:hypothetical protein